MPRGRACQDDFWRWLVDPHPVSPFLWGREFLGEGKCESKHCHETVGSQFFCREAFRCLAGLWAHFNITFLSCIACVMSDRFKGGVLTERGILAFACQCIVSPRGRTGNRNVTRGKSTRKKSTQNKKKKFIWTSFSEQFLLGSWLMSQGRRQKFVRTFRKVRVNAVFLSWYFSGKKKGI